MCLYAAWHKVALICIVSANGVIKSSAEMGLVMKFFHLSDLHFGKQLHGYDLAEEQRRFIRRILEAARKERPDAILIAGDIYDRAVPSGSAMTLFEELLLGIDEVAAEEWKDREGNDMKRPIEVILIAGNHDSAPRLRYGSTFLKRHHIHIAVFPPQQEEERMQKVILQDEYGVVTVYLLPYVHAGMLRQLPGAEAVQGADAAVRFLLEREKINWKERNILVSHQFYRQKGKETAQCDSEMPRLYAGGLDEVYTTAVEQFDYVALGHIHSPQMLGKEYIRYSGTPYPYSVSEAEQNKSITVVELGRKGELTIRELPFCPVHKVSCLKGTLEELVQKAKNGICRDYVSITLTDEEPLEAPKDYLEHYYERILEIRLDNTRSRRLLEGESGDVEELTPAEAFGTFFADVTGRKMNEQEEAVLQELLQELDC